MTHYKIILSAILFAAAYATSYAQTNGSNSSYSRYGLGTLDDQSQGFNKGMSGLAIGQRAGNRVNMTNPASYSSVDSLSFIFDMGMSLQNGIFKSGNNRINAYNTSLDYINAAFRIAPKLGVSFGFVPYSSIGYNYTESNSEYDPTTGYTNTSTVTYYGDGGIHELYIGAGWEPVKGLSIGVNIAYLWGNYYHTLTQSLSANNNSSSLNSNTLNRQYNADISTYKADFGLQYNIAAGKNNQITLGAIFGLGHNTDDQATLLNYSTNSDSIQYTAAKAFDLPYSFGAGFSWTHKERFMIGADVHHERWANCKLPEIKTTTDNSGYNQMTYQATTGAYLNRTKYILGAEFHPDRYGNRYAQRIQYKIGASYSTPYVKVNGINGPSEVNVSAGVGLPIINGINNRSVVNVSVQWTRVMPSVSSMITENYLKLNIGVTFNERWFMKWKIN